MSTSEFYDTVTVAEGVSIPADVADALTTLDSFFRDVTVEAGPLGDRSRQRGSALVAAEFARRVLTSGVARVIAAAERDADYVDDGHRAVRPWVNAHVNTSRSDALRDVQIAALGRDHPVVLDLMSVGSLGVAQARQLAAVFANPRIRDALVGSLAGLVDLAIESSYDVFVDHLRNWVALVDADGSHRDHETAHEGRRAHIAAVGNTTYLDAAVGNGQGAELIEILDRFSDAEFHAEWDALKAIHGDAMNASLLERTATQRRADALVAIFRSAATAHRPPRGKNKRRRRRQQPLRPVVNLVMTQSVFEEHLAARLAGRPARYDPNDPAGSWCATTTGIPIDPADAVAAALIGHVRRVVIDANGVIIGFGQRRRLFTGAARQAAAVQFLLQTGGRCSWAGCGHRRVELDHTDPRAAGGPTDLTNTGPLCAWHNRTKNHGYRTWRDRHGRWHTTRPDGTPINPT